MNRAVNLLLTVLLLALMVICTTSGLTACQQASSFISPTKASLPVTGVLITLPVLLAFLLVSTFLRTVSIDSGPRRSLPDQRYSPVFNGVAECRPHLLTRVFLL